eukprot:gene5395-9208_t
MSDLLKDLVTSENCDETSENPLNSVFQNFIDSSRTMKMVEEVKFDNNVQLSQLEKQKIKSRSNVMAKQFFPDKDENFVQDQMTSFLGNLKIENDQKYYNGMNSNNYKIDRKSNISNTFDELDEEDELLDSMDYNEMFNSGMLNFGLEDPEYLFSQENNPFLKKNNCFEIGNQLNQKGDLYQAILAFESDVIQNPKNCNSWRMLGKCHAECDDDNKAIAALSQAVKVDPNNLESLLDLACSYTNELNKFKALTNLKKWLMNHPIYGSNNLNNMVNDQPLNYLKLQDEVINMFLDSSKKSPDDVDLFNALGVLYNITDENENAIKFFKIAVKLKPNDHSLWNKLGATQANGKQSELAIESYRNALKIKPNYVRAWVNLGIAYSNLKRNEESVKYYLRALKMCPKSDHIWQYLGMSFYCLKRNDLVEKCRFKDVSAFDNEKF